MPAVRPSSSPRLQWPPTPPEMAKSIISVAKEKEEEEEEEDAVNRLPPSSPSPPSLPFHPENIIISGFQHGDAAISAVVVPSFSFRGVLSAAAGGF